MEGFARVLEDGDGEGRLGSHVWTWSRKCEVQEKKSDHWTSSSSNLTSSRRNARSGV